MRRLVVLVMSLAACGDDAVRHIIDAPPSPSDAPANRDGALPPPVSVTVTFAGAAQPGLNVYFTNGDGSPVSKLVTDATGTASQEMAAGGFVTVVTPTPIQPGIVRIPAQPPTLFTYAGVKPGDELLLQTIQATSPVAPVSFTLTTPVFTGATQYVAETWCAGALSGGELATPDGSATLVPNGTVFMPPGCSTADLIVNALDNTNTVLGALYHPALTVTQDQSVDLGAESFAASTTATFTYSNVPGTSVTAGFTRYVASGIGTGNTVTQALENNAATIAMTEPTLANSEAFVTTAFSTPNNAHTVLDWGGSGGDYTLDVTNQVLVDITDAPAFDLPTEKLTWTPGTTGVTPDLAAASLSFGGDAVIGVWNIVAPYTGGSIRLPPLVDFTPAATHTVQVDQLRTLKVPGGYDAARAGAFSVAQVGAGLAPGRALFDVYQPPLATAVLRKRRR